jgi:hypothetical protein
MGLKEKYVLLVDDKWVTAELTKEDVERIKEDIKGEYSEQYLITLENGESIDVGIIDEIREAEVYYRNKVNEAMSLYNDILYDAERGKITWEEEFEQM